MAKTVQVLQDLAKCVGDGQTPDLFFVSDAGVIITVTQSFQLAYNNWKGIKRHDRESCLEARSYGVVASVAPVTDRPGARLEETDCAADFRKFTKKK